VCERLLLSLNWIAAAEAAAMLEKCISFQLFHFLITFFAASLSTLRTSVFSAKPFLLEMWLKKETRLSKRKWDIESQKKKSQNRQIMNVFVFAMKKSKTFSELKEVFVILHLAEKRPLTFRLLNIPVWERQNCHYTLTILKHDKVPPCTYFFPLETN
jgi:hypothetical protein